MRCLSTKLRADTGIFNGPVGGDSNVSALTTVAEVGELAFALIDGSLSTPPNFSVETTPCS